MNIQSVVDTKKCMGCHACGNCCPVNCIEFRPDKEGFLFPNIDNSKCINCGLCMKSCPIKTNFIFIDQLIEPMVYAAKLKDNHAIKLSSSGGMFTAIVNYVLKQGGTVFGCVFDKNHKAKHIGAKDWKTIAMMRGSKYVQSDTGNTYSQVKELLKKDEYVLYTGTPCQIAGLKTLLNKSYDKLLTVDLICHGVPSPVLFSIYLGWLEQKHKGTIKEYQFRNKEKYGWGTFSKIVISTAQKEKTIFVPGTADAYYSPFLLAQNYRECCYSCKYANMHREGDLTIADYWGIARFHPEFVKDTREGVSLVLINTEKAYIMLQNLKTDLDMIPSKMEWAITENGNLKQPAQRPTARENFYAQIQTIGFDKYAKTFYKSRKYFKAKLKSIVPYQLKKVLKYIIYFIKRKC